MAFVDHVHVARFVIDRHARGFGEGV
jgi:hypothetical protein